MALIRQVEVSEHSNCPILKSNSSNKQNAFDLKTVHFKKHIYFSLFPLHNYVKLRKSGKPLCV